MPARKYAAVLAALVSLCAPALAQSDYPSKPVHIVVGFVPGASTDLIARLMANEWGRQLGQQFVVENKPGAASAIAADMVLADDNFATIVAAVEEGRGIYSNIRKTLQYLLAGSAAELLFMTLCVVIGLPTPLLPIHLLWINLVTDGLPALCLATDAIDPDVMKRRPRQRSRSRPRQPPSVAGASSARPRA